jgi:lactate dehydrogenase-like 2-hydroxyacid dehydrogenase
MALLLGLTWNLAGHNAAVRSGQFEQARGRAAPRELAGLKFGIVGMGRIGRAVARRAVHGFLMEVLYIDIADVGVLDFPARRVQPDELWTESDVVSLHVPLTSQTRQMIDRTALDQMKPSTVLINTSRGAVVDAPAVAEALRTGRLAGAGFDVFDHEPPPVNHPLLAAPNTLLTPHVGAKSERARKNMEAVVDDVICVLEGRPVRGLWVP